MANLRAFVTVDDVETQSFSWGKLQWLTDPREQWGCREYFEWIIRKNGHRIDDSGFYSIGVFDGYVTYIGRYRFGEVNLYLRFDAVKDDEGIGYPVP